MNERLPKGLKRMPIQSTAWVEEECGASRRLGRILEGPGAFLYLIAWRAKAAIFQRLRCPMRKGRSALARLYLHFEDFTGFVWFQCRYPLQGIASLENDIDVKKGP